MIEIRLRCDARLLSGKFRPAGDMCHDNRLIAPKMVTSREDKDSFGHALETLVNGAENHGWAQVDESVWACPECKRHVFKEGF